MKLTGFKIKTKEPPSDNQREGSSFVMKGFRVPEGFVLFITSKNGVTRTVESGHFSGGNAKFREVQEGKVDGWVLQKTSPLEISDTSVQETISRYVPEPLWGDSQKVGNCFLPNSKLFKRIKRISQDISDISTQTEFKKYLYSNANVTSIVQEYVDDLKSKGIEKDYNNLPKVIKFSLLKRIVDDANSLDENYHLYVNLVEEMEKRGVTEQWVSDEPIVPNNDLLTPYATQRLKDALLKVKSPEKEKSTAVNFVSNLISDAENGGILGFREKVEKLLPNYMNVDEEAAKVELLPLIKTEFVEISGEFILKKEILSNLKEQIDTLPEVDKLRLEIPEDLTEESVMNLLGQIKDLGYGFEKLISQSELEEIPAIHGRIIKVEDFPRYSVEGMSYTQSRFEILKRLLTPTSFKETYSEHIPNDEMAQTFPDLATEIICDYVVELGGSKQQLEKIVSSMLEETENALENEGFSLFSRYMSSNFPRKIPIELEPSVSTFKLSEYSRTLEALMSAHSEVFTSLYPEGCDVYRNVEGDIPEKVEHFTVVLGGISEFYTQPKELTKGVRISTKITGKDVVFLPSLVAWKTHWKDTSTSRRIITRPPTRVSGETESVFTRGRDTFTRSLDVGESLIEVEVVFT